MNKKYNIVAVRSSGKKWVRYYDKDSDVYRFIKDLQSVDEFQVSVLDVEGREYIPILRSEYGIFTYINPEYSIPKKFLKLSKIVEGIRK